MARKMKEDLRTPDEIRADVPPEHAAARTPELHAFIESEVLRKLRAEHHPINISVNMILSFAAPLGVGVESLAEYFDLELTEEVTSAEICRRLNEVMASMGDWLWLWLSTWPWP